MTDHDSMPSDRTRLVRAAADDALTASERAELDAHLARHPEDEATIDFERRLRERVQAAWTDDEAPEDLERRLRRMAAGGRRRVSRRLVWLAVAGSIATVAVLVIRGLVRPGPDDFGFDGRGALVRFLGEHPRNCPITIERTIEEFRVRRFDEALTELGSLVGRAPRLGDLTRAGLEFRGMGRCGVPGHEPSMHLLFAGADGSPLEGSIVNLYLQREDGRLPILDGLTYRLVPRARALAHVQMFVWRHEGIVFFVVTPDEAAGQAALAHAGAPGASTLL